ncbi:unnamed protein product, partial [marine sediment metagenome]
MDDMTDENEYREYTELFKCERDDSLIDMLEDRNHVKLKEPKRAYYPSEIALDMCHRKMVYQMVEDIETDDTTTPVMARILEMGNKCEEIIIDMAKASGRYVDDQIRMMIHDPRLKMGISGYCDMIIDESPNRTRNPK